MIFYSYPACLCQCPQRMAAQCLIYHHFVAPGRTEIVDIAAFDTACRDVQNLFQRQSLGAQLHVVRNPFAHFPLLVLHRVKFASQSQCRDITCAGLHFDQVAKADQSQPGSAQVQVTELYLFIARTAARQINPLVQLLPSKYMLVDQHLSQRELVVKTARAVGVGVQMRQGNIFRYLYMPAHTFPSLCTNTVIMPPCLTDTMIRTTIG